MTTGPRGREGGLDPQAEAALRALRVAEDMPPAAQARVWARLAASTGEDDAWSKGHVRMRRSEWAWGALVLAAAAALLLASRAGVLGPLVGAREGGEAAAYAGRGAGATEPVRAATEAAGPIEHVVRDMSHETDAAPAEPSPTQAPAATGRAGAARSEPRPRPRVEAGSTTEGPAAADARSTLAQEAEALARAQAAIQGGRADEALRLLADYAQQFPRGALREEHDALRALAQCAGDRAGEGRAAAELFLRAHGESALAERVRRGCLDG